MDIVDYLKFVYKYKFFFAFSPYRYLTTPGLTMHGMTPHGGGVTPHGVTPHGVTFAANTYNQTTGTRLARMLGHTEPTGSMTIGNSRTHQGYQQEGIYPRVQEVGWVVGGGIHWV